MTPQIKTIDEKKLIGKKLSMSFSDFKISELWQSFMPLLSGIHNPVSADLISMSVYPPGHFENFSPSNSFDKWAAIEVADFAKIPENLKSYVLPGGLYAVFHHKGFSNDQSIFKYIFGIWLPGSDYRLDNRPHFEVLGEKFKLNSIDSEEDIYIPIRLK